MAKLDKIKFEGGRDLGELSFAQNRAADTSSETHPTLCPSVFKLDLTAFSDFKGPTQAGGRSGWDSSFTDPRLHNPASFQYLVHGLQSDECRAMQMMALCKHLGTPDFSQHIDLSATPGRIREKKLISASVIDQSHIGTFGGAGLILSATESNILDMSHEDLGTNFADPSGVIENASKHRIPLRELLENTGRGRSVWNEIRLTGMAKDGEVSVVGFWIKADERGIPQSSEVAKRMKDLASLLGLPLITFVVESEAMSDQAPKLHTIPGLGGAMQPPWAVSMNKGGIRYFLDLSDEKATCVNRHRESRPMTKDEFETVRRAFQTALSPEAYGEIEGKLSKISAQFE